ncbi:MAG: hypothetical protein EH225_13250 [Calditrichaeota bacterium]|nr:hypothetical protein [Spirochaetales bacterium]RQV98525.1 MAG: hypothetical protein EH225_13250 [Calditrichota bacterium]
MAEKWETKGQNDTYFHSSRKERYKMGNIEDSVEKKGFFAKNPSFRIFLIDLVFIIIISGIIVPFIYKREGVGNVGEFSLQLKAFRYDDRILVTLTVENRQTSGKGDSYIEALFYTIDPETGIIVGDLLPEDKEKRILKASLVDDGGEYVHCRIELSGSSKVLKKKIG